MSTPSNYHKQPPRPTRRFVTMTYYTGGPSNDPRVPDEPLKLHMREQPGDVVTNFYGRAYKVQENGSVLRTSLGLRRAT